MDSRALASGDEPGLCVIRSWSPPTGDIFGATTKYHGSPQTISTIRILGWSSTGRRLRKRRRERCARLEGTIEWSHSIVAARLVR